MKVLYVAAAVEVDGSTGGATHVNEVACGLRKLGHRVVVVARAESRETGPRLECGVPFVRAPWRKELALAGTRRIARVISRFQPDVVIERYYNFAGAGVLVAHRRGIPVLLEVNAPMTDPPGSLKTRLDRFLLGAMRHWAVRQGAWSSAIVTPLETTVPPEVPRDKIQELPWGANVDRFNPHLREQDPGKVDATRRELGLAGGPVAVFLGSFRHWHGVRDFAQAARQLIEDGSTLSFLAVGGGPELPALVDEVRRWSLPEGRLVFAGARPHEEVPDLLTACDIGIAPFDVAAHPPLKEFGFYWSPLKVFEYMAAGLPVVTIDVAPLNDIVRNDCEGLLYRSGDMVGLVGALATLERDREARRRMGASARERVVAWYSWRAHCEALDLILRGIVDAK